MSEQFGRYRLDEILGQGGMGIVYRAWDSVLERVVALKMVRSDGDLDRDVRERFLREARSAAQLTHKNIVTIYDLGEQAGRPYLAMEFLDGEDLQRRLARAEKTSLWRKINIAIEICQGLEFAHAHGVIHRDVKPGNIFLTASGVKILDFGLARLMSSQLTQSNMLLGTINYMSPEQVRGERADQQSDLFSVGVVLYELFGSRRAFEGDSAASTLFKILQEVPEPLWKIDAELPRELMAIIDRALAKPRDERYPDVASMRRDLELLPKLAGQSGPVTPWPVTGAASPMPPRSGPASLAGPPTPAAVPPVPPSNPAWVQNPAPGSGSGAATPPGSIAPAPMAASGSMTGVGWAGVGAGALAAVSLVIWMATRHSEPAVPPQAPATSEPQTRSLPPPSAAPASAPAPVTSDVPGTPASSRQPVDPQGAAKHDARVPAHTEPSVQRAASPNPPAAGRRAGDPPSPPPSTPLVATSPAPQSAAPAAAVAASPPVAPPAPVTTSAPPPPPAASPTPRSSPAALPAAVEAPSLTVERAGELLQLYKASLEARSLDQLKRLWPSLGGPAEAAIRQEFQHASRITVGISDIQVSASGGSITFVRNYGLVTVDGQRLQSASQATMAVHRSGDAWLIDSIRFTPR